jgi:hypothetical protein
MVLFITGLIVGALATLMVCVYFYGKQRDEDNKRFLERMTRINQKYQASQLEVIRMQRGAVSAQRSTPS